MQAPTRRLCGLTFSVAAAVASGAAAEPVVATPAETAEAEVVPVCKTEFRLSGAVYVSSRPEQSFALVQFRSNEPGQVVRVGTPLGAFELLAIEPRGVLLRSAEGVCWLRLVGDPAVRAQRAASPPRRPTPPAPPPKKHKPKGKAKAKPKPQKPSDVVVIGRR